MFALMLIYFGPRKRSFLILNPFVAARGKAPRLHK